MDTNFNLVTEKETGLFYFESDHLALKGNRDYGELLKTLVLLELQYTKTVKNCEKVMEIQDEALSHPFSFYKKIMKGEDIGIPHHLVLAELPNINWLKYSVEQLPKEIIQFLQSDSGGKKFDTEQSSKHGSEGNSHSSSQRVWSVEEQKRLEELLVIYPPEPVELRRYKKIATALGNRTVQQVSSRLQKYFLKLYKAGLPIPGRIPKNAEKSKRSKLHSHQRFNHLLLKPTTFFPQLDIPVTMNEDEATPGPSTDVTSSSSTDYKNYLLPNSSESTRSSLLVNESRSSLDWKIDLLKRVKTEKEKEKCNNYPVQHIGYKCNYCTEEPIYGTRWHCEDCTTQSIDFCTDCVVGQIYSAEPHPPLHELRSYSEEIKMDTDTSNESISQEEVSDSDKNKGSDNNSDSGDSGSENSSTENEQEDLNLDEDHSSTNDFGELSESDQEEGIDIDEHKTNRMLNFDQNSENFSVSTDPTIDKTDWLYNSQYFNELLNLKSGPYVEENLVQDSNDSLIDVPNLSYNYLHSNLLFDEN